MCAAPHMHGHPPRPGNVVGQGVAQPVGAPPMDMADTPARLVAPHPEPPTAPLAGLQIDGRPKAHIQRRLYAHEEAQRNTDGNGVQGSQYRAANTSAGQLASPGQSVDNGGPSNGSSYNRIDPSQIPRPDSARKAEKWSTRANVGQCAPPATSAFVAEDDGNCSPRYMRATLNQVINTSELLSSSGIPCAVIAQPLADVPSVEGAVPIVDFGEAGPVR